MALLANLTICLTDTSLKSWNFNRSDYPRLFVSHGDFFFVENQLSSLRIPEDMVEDMVH